MTDVFSVLVVGNEKGSLAQLTNMLRVAGYEVWPAESGEQALAFAAATPPRLILLDIRMPDLDGFEICRRLKSVERTRDIPVMFITERTDTEERVQGFQLGAVDFINKFFPPEEMLARVRTQLELDPLRANPLKVVAERTDQLQRANERLREELAQRRLAEQALRESEQRFRGLADTAPVGIWVTNPDKLPSFYNKRALTFTGRTMNQLIGNRWTEIVHPEDRHDFCAAFEAAIAARRGFRMECRMQRADGQYRWVLNTGIPRFVDRVYIGHIGTVIDTTDLRLSHEQLLANEKLESLGALAAGIAHDFNNVLGAIFGESDVALLETTSDSPGRENIERIKAIAVRASEIVKLLMAYAGDADVAKESVDLTHIVEGIIDRLRGSISERILLHVNLAKDLLVRANPPQIQKVVLNLIKNAEEALGGRNGLISVTTERVHIGAPVTTENSSDLSEGEYARLVVSDTGCGMSPEVRARALDPFYTTKFLGRGLGLAVVQGILRSHCGRIDIRSKPGEGSTFEILLPCADLPSERAERSYSSRNDSTNVQIVSCS